MSRRGDWMTTRSGKRFWPADPRPEDIDLTDIAHALSNLCHWNGHCSEFFSVAQHSILVAEHMPDPWKPLGLLHDAHEAYLGDLIRPVFRSLPLEARSAWADLKRSIDVAIFNRFGLRAISLQALVALREADNRTLATEARDLVNSDGERWWDGSLGQPYEDKIRALSPSEAYEAFLETAGRLGVRIYTGLAAARGEAADAE